MKTRSAHGKRGPTQAIRRTVLALVSMSGYAFLCVRPLYAAEAMDGQQFGILMKSVGADTPTAIMAFKSGMVQDAYSIGDDGQKTQVHMAATMVLRVRGTRGNKTDILAVNGTFRLLHPIAGEFPDEEVVNEHIPVETRWGGDLALLRLKALIPLAGDEQERVFVVVRPSTQAPLMDSSFIGPIEQDQIEETRGFLRFLVTFRKGKDLPRAELLRMLQSGRLLDTRFALVELRVHEGLSAKEFLLAIRSLPEKYSADIAYDLFMECRLAKSVKDTMLDSLRWFLDGSSPEKEVKVLKALGVAIERMSWLEDNQRSIPDALLLLKDYQGRTSGDARTEVSRAEAERVSKLIKGKDRAKHE